jgi:hypothetical protein
MRGYGWRAQNERNGTNTFCWIEGLEADISVELDLIQNRDVEIYARPFYYDNCYQHLALFVNNRYVAEWRCERHPEWTFDRYTATVPASRWKTGRNKLTFRTTYSSEHKPGLSLAVERVVLRSSAASVRGYGKTFKSLMILMIAIMVVLVLMCLYKGRSNCKREIEGLK